MKKNTVDEPIWAIIHTHTNTHTDTDTHTYIYGNVIRKVLV
jgi:hypothetical protein